MVELRKGVDFATDQPEERGGAERKRERLTRLWLRLDMYVAAMTLRSYLYYVKEAHREIRRWLARSRIRSVSMARGSHRCRCRAGWPI